MYESRKSFVVRFIIGIVVLSILIFSKFSLVSQGFSESKDKNIRNENLGETEENVKDTKGIREVFGDERLTKVLNIDSTSQVDWNTPKNKFQKGVEDKKSERAKNNAPKDDSKDNDYSDLPYYPGNFIVKYEGSYKLEKFLSLVKEKTGLADAELTKLAENIYLLESKNLEKKSLDLLESNVIGSSNTDYELAQVLDKVESIPGVLYSEPDYQVKVLQFTPPPNDPLYPNQWALAKIQAEAAWNVEQGSSAVVIAVVDSGVDLDHPDLVDNLWVNPREIAGNGIDDDGNGFVDDVYGYNFIDFSNNVDDDYGHGTICAGIAAAKTNNNIGISGLCPNCKIMVLKFINAEGRGWVSRAVLSIQYAVDQGAEITTNSWGSYSFSQSLQDVINAAYSQGVHTVAAAANGNTSEPSYPAAMAHVIGVSGTNQSDGRFFLSNYGYFVDVSAPAMDVLSTFPPGVVITSGCGDWNGDGYDVCSGNSMAAPHVAGMLGLMKAFYQTASIDELEERLYAASVDLGDPGWDQYFGWGRINAFYGVGKSDLTVTITDSPDPVFVGDDLVYTVSVINNGPANAARVALTQNLPASASFVSAVPQQGNCTESGRTVTCNLGISRVGASIPVEVTVIPSAGGPRRRVETTTASVSALTEDPNASNNTTSENTTVYDLSLRSPVMVYPQDGQILGWGANQSYMFKVEPVADAVGYWFSFRQDNILIHEEYTANLNGEFAIHPDHPQHGVFRVGYVVVSIRARLVDGELTEPRVITIALADYSDLSPPVLLSPYDGQRVQYNGMYGFKLEPVLGARGYLFGFFQNGVLVYEELTTNPFPYYVMTFSSSSFNEGSVQVWIRALLGSNWTRARKITIILDPDAPPWRP